MQIFWEQGYLKLAVVRFSTPMHEWVRMNDIDFKILEAKGTWPLRAGRSLASIIDDNAIDVVHINWGGDLKLAVLAKWVSKRRPVLVYSRHMRIPESKRDPYHRLIYRQVDRLIVTTQEMYRQATAHLPINPEKVHHLYLGVGQPKSVENHTCAQFLTEGGLSRDRFSIGLFGRVEHTKGQHVLIEAVRHLVELACDVQAVIVGEAKTPAFHHSLEESIVEYALQDRVRLHVFMADANRFMSCFDVVVLCSYCEHFGLVLIEAMHAGVAVIGTAAGGVPEIIEDGRTGLLCAPGSATDLADKIKLLYDNQSMRDSLAKAGQERAQELFSETRHFDTLCNHFEQTVNQCKSSD